MNESYTINYKPVIVHLQISEHVDKTWMYSYWQNYTLSFCLPGKCWCRHCH